MLQKDHSSKRWGRSGHIMGAKVKREEVEEEGGEDRLDGCYDRKACRGNLTGGQKDI